MAHPTPLLGREDAFEHVVRQEQALVVGPPGIGRTAFLRELVTRTGARLVPGREAMNDTAFLPLVALLREHGIDVEQRLSALTQAPAALLASSTRLAVDDADHLDEASAVLVSQIARAGVPVVLAVANAADLPRPLRDVGLALPRVTLRPLLGPEVAVLASHRLGHDLDPPSVAALVRRSVGIPLVVMEIVDAAAAAGAVEVTTAGLHLTQLPATPAALSAWGVEQDAVGRWRPLLHELAVAVSLPLEVLDGDALAGAVASGLVVEDGAHAHLSSQLVADVCLADLSAPRRAALAADLAERLTAHDHSGDGSDRWATLAARLRSVAGVAETTPEGAADAAHWLRGQDRREEALELLSNTDGPGIVHLVARADVLADLGRVPAAVTVLEDAAVLASAAELGEVLTRLTDLIGGGAEADRRLAQTWSNLLPRVDEQRREALESIWARRQVIRGGTIGTADDVALLLRESLTGSLADARSGAAIDAADDGAPATDEVALDHELRKLIHFLSLVYDGQIVEARDIAEREYAAALDPPTPVLGLWGYNRAKIALHAGQVAIAVERGENAVQHLRWRDPFGLLLSAEALYAAALARTGELDKAVPIADGLTPDDRLLPRVLLGVARVRAEQDRRKGRPADGAAALLDAGEFAIAHDEAHSGLLGLDEAFWLDPTQAGSERLQAMAGASGLASAFADRASALLSGDRPRLAEVADRLEQMIQPGRAAATWLAVADLASAAGDEGAAGAARRQAHRLCLQWECDPWTRESETPRLSGRELQVARHAAARRPSKDIAEDLGLSVRTVDNHLARVFRKLSSSSREDLAEVLGLTGSV